MNIEIREATERDLPHILSLYFQPEMDDEILPLEKAEEIFCKMKSYPDYRVYVAMHQGEVVGTFALLIMDNLAHMGAPSGVVEDVVVKEGLHGQGIGRQMMQFALDLCSKKGCYKMALSSNLKRERAHRFYESLGFVKHGYSFLIDCRNKTEEKDV
ncbi:MAG TPA: GNAT family N-acetyltransferase [Bacillota bacterium]|nr:GNAT family N-acetyltransferase [Bacillota bacterium]